MVETCSVFNTFLKNKSIGDKSGGGGEGAGRGEGEGGGKGEGEGEGEGEREGEGEKGEEGGELERGAESLPIILDRISEMRSFTKYVEHAHTNIFRGPRSEKIQESF
jgi:hypothetical protein